MNEKYLVTWEQLHHEARKLASRLLPATRWQGIIAVSRGGLVPAAILARELGLRHVDTVCVSSYDHDQQRQLHIIKQASGDGEGFLLVDDLVDSGETLAILRQLYPKAYVVTLFAKPAGKRLVDDYVTDISQDMWIELPWDMTQSYVKPYCEQ